MSKTVPLQDSVYKRVVDPLTGKITLLLLEEGKTVLQQRDKVKLRLSASPLYQAMLAKHPGYWRKSSLE